LNRWYKLDNAAKLFPPVTSEKNSSVFRVSAVLTDEIDKEILQKTVDYVYDRFPMMFVRMRRGVFWHYFDNNWDKFRIQEEKDFPCGTMNPYENNGYLLKILYYNKRISIEVFHSLTDGGGAVELLKTILFYYFNFLCDNNDNCIDSEGKIILIDDGVSADNMEDSFIINYKKVDYHKQKLKRSFKVRGTPFETYGNNVITGIVSADELNKLAKTKNATITSYIVSLLIYAIYMARQKYTRDKNPIMVSVPVNLRKSFPSKTLRNFFVVVKVGMTVDKTTKIDDIIEEITKQLKTKTEKPALQELIAQNMKLEKRIYSRFVPLFLKKIVIMIAFNIMGETKKTITVSNIGNISIPSGFSSKINLMEAILYPTPRSPVNCAICSANDKLAISFSRTIIEADIIKYFMNYLSENGGLAVDIYSNDWGSKFE